MKGAVFLCVFVAVTAASESQCAADARLSPYERSVDFPPVEIGKDPAQAAEWYREVFGAVPMKEADPTTTPREREMYRWSALQFVEQRRANHVTCLEYAAALVKRARYYRYMNHWIFTTYPLLDRVLDAARELDEVASRSGVEALAPLYCLPIPMKGTAAVVDFPSGSGSGILSGYTPVKDSHLTARIKAKNGIIFGATNVPEFAASWVTANPASGQTRNAYDHKLTVGGSSGGSGAAVAAYMCPVAVTEDTGGSTRVPAYSNLNFGFDPSRNHFDNTGNPGMTYTNDQLGVNTRDMADLLWYDRALTDREEMHDAAALAVAALPASAIRVGVPQHPFVETVVGEGLYDMWGIGNVQVEAGAREKYDKSRAAISAAGITLVAEEWPSKYFDYLGRGENVLVEALFSGALVNGKPMDNLLHPALLSFTGQMSEFARAFLDAPVSPKEIMEDAGVAGASHAPAGFMGASGTVDESQFRYFLGPNMKKHVEAYNSYFDTHNVDLILMPAQRCLTQDLDALAAGTVPITDLDGKVTPSGSVPMCHMLHYVAFKHIHIPMLAIPTGLADGRPSGVQVWGRAVPYESMYDDDYSASHDVRFLHVAGRVAEAIHTDASLRRVEGALVKDLFE